MDRQIVYPGAIQQDTDVLGLQVNAMVALGYALRLIVGTGTVVDGLAATPTVPASMSVFVSEGGIAVLTQVDATAFSSIPLRTDPLMKLGVNTLPTQLTFAAPTTVGQSQAFVIQSAFDEHDDLPVVMPYYNSANPAIGFAGPGNTGVPQNGRRVQRALISVKPGAPASSGSQTVPAADVGYAPLYVVTLTNGQTTITATSIAIHPQSPALPWKLGQVGPTISRMKDFLTTDTAWIAPPGVTMIEVEVQGAGGCGGGTSNINYPGGGGGGGGYSLGQMAVIPGTSYPVSVALGTSNGTQPAVTTFASISATGGLPGGQGSASGVGVGGGGGAGSGGTVNRVGSSGTYGIVNPSGNSEGGMGGTAYKAAGPVRGVGGYGTAFNANPGITPGGGSTGCTGSAAAGGNGAVTIRW